MNKELFDRITAEIRKIYVGQDELVLGTLVALFSNGHVLIESVPGLGKTLFVRALGRVLGCRFGRIQFTADLMPSDITGCADFRHEDAGVSLPARPGLHATAAGRRNQPLAGQNARRPVGSDAGVSRDDRGHDATRSMRPFLVMATQNPIESEGTYNLPEAQLDRFMLKLVINYPSVEEEASVLEMHSTQVELDSRLGELQTVTNPEEIVATTQRNGQVTVDPKLLGYINSLVRSTRDWPQFHLGASPRAGIARCRGRGRWRRFAAAITPCPTTSSNWPCPCSATASSSRPRPKWKATRSTNC